MPCHLHIEPDHQVRGIVSLNIDGNGGAYIKQRLPLLFEAFSGHLVLQLKTPHGIIRFFRGTGGKTGHARRQ